jgi:ketosteroid isomerase-like protein/mono/diheme cytochrome c family protein
MKIFKASLIIVAVLIVAGIGFVYAGIFNVAADEPHWKLTYRVIEFARDRSIAVRAVGPQAPSLDDTHLIAMGAGHYDEMCTGCHLAPGRKDSELRAGMNPKPPNLAEHGMHRSPAQTFWIIKHGLKMTAMPAWGITHDDHSIWAMVAFVNKLPQLSPDAYRKLVGQGGGHSHGDEGHGPDSEAVSEFDDEHSHQDNSKIRASAQDHAEDAGSDPSHHAVHNGATSAAGTLPASAAEPVAVVDEFFRALASGDTAGVTRILDPAVLIYESGGAERSREEYSSHHLGSDVAFLKTARHRLLSRTGDTLGDLAWVASESQLSSSSKGKPVSLVSTETIVLRKTSEGWRIVHIHWSSRRIKDRA